MLIRNLNIKRIKAVSLLLLLFLSLITALPILNYQNASAITTSSSKSTDLKWQVQSYQYYKVISACIDKASRNTGTWALDLMSNEITAERATKGEWFRATDDNHVGIGVFMKDAVSGDPYQVGDDGVTDCGDPDLINSALSHWGLDSLDVLCNSGFTRKNQGGTGLDGMATCLDKNSSDTFIANTGDKTQQASKFKSYIKKVVYGIDKDSSDDIALTDPEKYTFYLHTIGQSCITQIESTKPDTAKKDESDKKNYNDVSWVDIGVSPPAVVIGSYAGQIDRAAIVGYDYDKVGRNYPAKTESCLGLKNKLGEYAQAFADWAVKNKEAAKDVVDLKGTDTGDGSDEPKTCGGEVANIGWIICPIVTALTGLNDLMWDLTSKLLNVSPLEQSGDTSGVYEAWGVMRNLANVAFVIVFLIIIFSQVSSVGISNYGIKKLLPRIIIGALLVNMSFLIVQVAVDIANITGSSIFTILKTAAPDSETPSWAGLITAALAPTLVAGGVAAGAVITGGALIWMIALFAIIGCLTLLAAFLTLIFRQGIILILVIIAPLAFVAYLLPNTEKWFDKWKDLLIQMLMLYPIAAIVFGGAQFASIAIYNSDKGWWTTLMSLIILCLPLFSLPFLATKGGAILSKVNGSMMGVVNKLRNPVSKFTDSKAALAKGKYLATAPGKYNIAKRADFAMRRRSNRRSIQAESYKKQSDEMFAEDLKDNTNYYTNGLVGSTARSHIEGTVAKLEAQELTSAIQSLERSIAAERAAGNNTDDFLINIANNPNATLMQQKAAVHSLASQGRADKIRDMRNSNQAAPENETAEARTIRERKLQTIQEAIQANSGKLAGKAPDLVKNSNDGAFNGLTAESLAGFSAGTGQAMVEHFSKLQTAASAPGASEDTKKTYSKAIASFNSSMDQISKNNDYMGKFEGPTGESIISAINAHSSLKAEMTGASYIDSSGDFKIKPISTSVGNTSGGGI